MGKLLKKYDRRKIATKILLGDSFNYSIRNATFVNSRSILFACDVHPADPRSSHANTDYLDSIISKINTCTALQSDNLIPSVYVSSDGLTYFAKEVLPKIDQPFILVSGDSDLPINHSILGIHLETLLKNPYLVRWFAQNRDVDAPKIFSLPIGINIHNLWADPLQWGGGFILPALQELQLKTIAEQSQPLADRETKIFCNWHFSIDRADRKACLDVIDKTVCYFQPEPAPMTNTWALQSKYQFVLSPHGAGLDCHRTWEALLLGCIPIVKSAKINDLFNELPVISVSEWSEVNPTFLKNALREIEARPVNAERLLMRYWISEIKHPNEKLNS
ncbi:hypothetical protein A9236_06805 [Polynucleobacter sp. QLW-P1DATA-2]|uniref:hypothetical protein n=1 Tax=unclassified Polynucleobacter TaxID=2640945 RepID=UPI0008F8B595|nr:MULTISPECIES: hypothetical protein [unclassified Polynucleobacter]OIN00895.1 hypothetical protein A9236_06805 [Polynucleobacter sp. QLW-P1DATA-2]OIN02462.1 hypothetical protein A9235_01885 [Polynucleobacter sp. MWH-Tro8-2-5-gr]